MMPQPRDRLKKVKPMALRTLIQVSLSKLKSKRNFTPSMAPGNDSERIMMTIIRMKSVGSRYFERRSMPFTTPRATTPQVSVRKERCHSELVRPSPTKAPNVACRTFGSLVTRVPPRLSKRYFTHQPPTTE